MNEDTSPLALKGVADRIAYFQQWMPRMRAALAGSTVFAPEVVLLLQQGSKIWVEYVHEQRDRYAIYLSLAAGANIPLPDNYGEGYWAARRLIEAEARRGLVRMVFSIPVRITKRMEDPRLPEFYKADLMRQLSQLLHNTLADREILRHIFTIFDPTSKTNARWWNHGEGLSEEEQTAALFFSWLLKNIWGYGFWKNPELTTWARRRTAPWILRFNIRPPDREIRDAMRKEPWMRFFWRGKIGRLKMRKRVNPVLLRASRRAIRERYARTRRKVTRRTSRYTSRPKKIPTKKYRSSRR